MVCDRAGLTGLVGREGELSRLGGLVDPPPARSEVLVLLGDAGAGKTAVLDEVARRADAKPVLTAALETFRRLGCAPWSRRAEAELRACGVTAAAAAAPDAGGLTALTPQQREIVVLAGRGLTNAEIADRLYLSPRTVASHLYRSYPKLRIAGRHQLAALIARSGADPGASE